MFHHIPNVVVQLAIQLTRHAKHHTTCTKARWSHEVKGKPRS